MKTKLALGAVLTLPALAWHFGGDLAFHLARWHYRVR